MARSGNRVAKRLAGSSFVVERRGDLDIHFDGEHLASVERFEIDDFYGERVVHELGLFRLFNGKYVLGVKGLRRHSWGEVLDSPEQVFQQLCDKDGSLGELEKLLLAEAGKRDPSIRSISRIEFRLDSIKQLAEELPHVSSIVRSEDLEEHIHRLRDSIDTDTAQAIGSAKELVETVVKQVLDLYGQRFSKEDDLPKLGKAALKALRLSPDDVPEDIRGADYSRRVLAGLLQIVWGIAELRGLYGTGHGKLRKSNVTPRHARLVVGAAATVCRFILETLEIRSVEGGRGSS